MEWLTANIPLTYRLGYELVSDTNQLTFEDLMAHSTNVTRNNYIKGNRDIHRLAMTGGQASSMKQEAA